MHSIPTSMIPFHSVSLNFILFYEYITSYTILSDPGLRCGWSSCVSYSQQNTIFTHTWFSWIFGHSDRICIEPFRRITLCHISRVHVRRPMARKTFIFRSSDFTVCLWADTNFSICSQHFFSLQSANKFQGEKKRDFERIGNSKVTESVFLLLLNLTSKRWRQPIFTRERLTLRHWVRMKWKKKN